MAPIWLLLAAIVLMGSLLLTSPWRVSVVMVAVAFFTATWIEFRSVGGATLSDPFLVAGAAATVVARSRSRWRAPIDLSPQFDLILFATALTLGGTLGGLLSGGPRAGFVEAAQFSVAVLVVAYVVSTHATNVRSWELLAGWFVAGALVSALVAHWPSNRTEYLGRASGLTSHPNHLALVMMLACGFAAALPGSDRRWLRALGWVALPFLLNALVWSGSRAGLAGLLAGLLAFAVLSRAKGIVLMCVGMLAGILVLLLVLPRRDVNSASAIDRLLRPGDTERESNAGRWEYLSDAAELIQRRPIFGRGFEEALRVHSVPLQLLVMAGLFGVVAIVALVRFGLRATSLARRPHSTRRVRAMAALIVGLGAFWIVSNALFDRYLLLALSLSAAGLAVEDATLVPRRVRRNTAVRHAADRSHPVAPADSTVADSRPVAEHHASR